MAGGVAATAIRYYFDEHTGPGMAVYLRAHQIDVLTTQEAGRAAQGLDDADQLMFATARGSVIVSSDSDFLNPKVVPQLSTGQHARIAHLKENVDIGNQARYLRSLAETETLESMTGQIRYYEPIPHGLFPDD